LLCGVFEKVVDVFGIFFAEQQQRRRTFFDARRFLFFILSAMLVFSVFSVMVRDVKCRSRSFWFVEIGDTQAADETQLQSVVDFVVGNMTYFDIRYVVHMGDFVEVCGNETDWEMKSAAFSQLTGVVPFGWLVGDNDGESRGYLGANFYAFNVSNYPNMTSSYDQGRSTAQYLNFGGVEILFVNLEYFANDSALRWFENLYDNYDEATVIFSTHSYLDFFGNYTEDTLNSTYLDAFPRVKLVLCGHIVYALNREVNGRQEIRFDYQEVPGYVTDLSDFIRLYTVFDDGSVDALTYSQLRNLFLVDPSNQFSFTLFASPTPTPSPTTSPTSTPTPESTTTPSPSTTPTPDSTLSPSSSPTPAVPEFSSWLVLSILFLAVVSLALLFRFRKRIK
jgi:hypothetical protein